MNKRDQSICSNFGTFGILIAATCLVQQMIFGTDHWLVFVMMGIYLFSIVSFILLTLQKVIAPPVMIAATALVFIAEVLLTLAFSFSLVVVLLLTYSLIAVIAVYIENIPVKLKQKALAQQAEEMAWRDKI